jgi:hypothetical protein
MSFVVSSINGYMGPGEYGACRVGQGAGRSSAGLGIRYKNYGVHMTKGGFVCGHPFSAQVTFGVVWGGGGGVILESPSPRHADVVVARVGSG